MSSVPLVIISHPQDKMNVKLARNRESARNSRKRKKIYIELLEKKVDQLTNELNQTRKQLELNSNNLNKITFQSKLVII
jgi:predicted  nucleic acid-binding Zn-ribbon protein